ncbi:class C beta-lactamase [Aureimonas frigidaquae]|uniref:class C beta-lactamase n=1 Tax=Aureimonas frigidaquae TaxID=424757 RepID=UPI0007863DE3|nr:class C beta-lactamase [Aureimonas frigidaquae]
MTRRLRTLHHAAGMALAGLLAASGARASEPAAIDASVCALMAEHAIPGMAVGLSKDGQVTILTYGVARPGGREPVTADTIFEIGSISKTFTATLGAYAQASGTLSLDDPAGRHLPALDGHPIGAARLVDLATYAAGGLPLQFPDGVSSDADAIAWAEKWTPREPAGTVRQYSNPSIGLFGYVAAQALGEDFQTLMQDHLFPAFQLKNTFITVPQAREGAYAKGVARNGRTVRVNPGALDAEAYGVKTTAGDLLAFLNAQMDPSALPDAWRQAVETTHIPHYRTGPMRQALGWEVYPADVPLDDLMSGNGTPMALELQPIEPVGDIPADLLLNKTGSTAGFGAYAVAIPSKRLAIVILANRSYPNAERVKLAYEIIDGFR